MIISISGTAGSGKSTIAKNLAKELRFKHYSMGDLQREVAEEKGITIVELGELEKKDSTIDKMIDAKQRELGEKEDNFVIDGWLAPNFIPHALKIFLDADIKERARRRVNEVRSTESYKNLEEAEKSIIQRQNTNRKRWIEFYDFDFMDMANYDHVVDTTKIDAEKALKEVRRLVSKAK